jgi:hypothetical protein
VRVGIAFGVAIVAMPRNELVHVCGDIARDIRIGPFIYCYGAGGVRAVYKQRPMAPALFACQSADVGGDVYKLFAAVCLNVECYQNRILV